MEVLDRDEPLAADPGLTLTLEGNARDPRVARAEARAFLASNPWAVLPDDAYLVLSELVTNAVLHGGGPVTVTLSPAPPDLIIAVTDRSNAEPFRLDPDSDDEHGRGLGIVNRLTKSWHVVHTVGAKTIVAVVPLRQPASV